MSLLLMRVVIPFLFIFFFIAQVESQRINNHETTIEVNGRKYLANLNFYHSGNDTIYHGDFQISKQFDEVENQFKFYSLDGVFERNVPVKTWSLRQGYFTPTAEGFYKDYTYSHPVNGHELMVTGNFEKGKKVSKWQVFDWIIENSQIKDTVLMVSLPYVDDVVEGKFEIYKNGEFLEGRIGENGMPEGEWNFYQKDDDGKMRLSKKWIFEDNLMVSKALIKGNESFEINLRQFGEDESERVTVKLDKKYFEIIDTKAHNHNPDPLLEEYKNVEKASELFFEIFYNFQRADSLFNPILDVSLTPSISVKLPVLPIREDEKNYLSGLKKNFELADSTIKVIINDSRVKSAANSTAKMAWYQSVVSNINENLLLPVKEILDQKENGTLRHFNREKLINRFYNFLTEVEGFSVLDGDTIIEKYQFKGDYEFLKREYPALRNLNLYTAIIKEEIEDLHDQIFEFIEVYYREEQLVILEKDLFEKHHYLKNLNDSMVNVQHDYFAGFQISPFISAFLDRELDNYKRLSDIDQKMEAIDGYHGCFNRTENLIENILQAPENINSIYAAYTKRAFNPFTFTEMEERVKPPLFKAFNRLFLPGIFENLKNLNCNNVENYSNNFEVLFNGMIDLLQSETRKEERKLRRIDDPQKASEVLGLTLKF